MPDFSRRSLTPELMDETLTDFVLYRDCLADLARVNRATFTHWPTIAFLNRLRRRGLLPKDRPLRLLDVASGYGDLLRAVARWAKRCGVAVDLVGLDLNPRAGRAASEATDPEAPIRWVTGDLFDYHPAEPVDVITSTQFAHHLDDAQICDFLAWMERTATLGWFLTDLHRHPIPYHVFGVWARMARWHEIVRIDGRISITRSLSVGEWRDLLHRAGLDGVPVKVSWQVPFRIAVARVKPS